MQGTLNASLSSNNAAYARIKSLEKKLEALTSEVNVDSSQIEAIQQEIAKYKADMSANVTADNITATTNLTSNGSTHLKTLTADERITAVKGIDAETNIVVGKDESKTEITGNKVQTSEVSAAVISANGKVSAGRLEAPEASINNLEVTGDTTINGTIATVGKASFNDVEINHDLLFPKVDSNINGEYLNIHAKDAAFTGNLQVEGPAVIGGSVSVKDTLAAKNLIVVGEVLMSGLKLDAKTELTNPTFKGIKGTNELTTTALVIDNEGKLVSKKISSEVEGSVASSLVAQRETRTHTILDEWKPNADNTLFKIPVSSTAQFVVNETGTGLNILLTNENGNQKVINELGVALLEEVASSIVHRNFVYIIHPTMENGSTFKCVVIPINTETMEVSPSFDITQYFGQVSSSDFHENVFEVVTKKATFQLAMCGMVLPDDVPTMGFIGTNNYLDLSAMEIKTRDTAFSANWCVLSKNGNWIELPGYVVDSNFYCTNGKYSSVEDAALGVPASDYIVNPETDQIERQLFYVDAPVFGSRIEDNTLVYLDGGAVKEVAFADIPGYSRYESIFGTVDKDGNPIDFSTMYIISGETYKSNLYLMGGYYPREYFASTTISYVDTIIIDKNKVEINGSTFVDGVWYDKVVSSTNALIDFITKPKDKKRYKVLFTGESVELNTADSSQVPTSGYSENDIYGTFDIYHINDINGLHLLKLNGTPTTLTRMDKLLDACHWHGFSTTVDILFCSNTSNLGADWPVKYLHINDCSISFKTNGNAVPQNIFYLGISDSNNVTYQTVDIPTSLFNTSAQNKEVDVTLSKCYNVVFNGKYTSSSTAASYKYTYSNIRFDRCDRCEDNVYVSGNVISKQYGPGYNFTYNAGAGSGSELVLPTVVNQHFDI